MLQRKNGFSYKIFIKKTFNIQVVHGIAVVCDIISILSIFLRHCYDENFTGVVKVIKKHHHSELYICHTGSRSSSSGVSRLAESTGRYPEQQEPSKGDLSDALMIMIKVKSITPIIFYVIIAF